MNIKDLTPPIVVELLKAYKGIGVSKKLYSSYEEALADCPNDAYENIELCNMIADKTVIYKNESNQEPRKIHPNSVHLLLAINQYLTKNEELILLDFGGAAGAHYYEIRHFLPRTLKLRWLVIETSQMVKSAKEKGLNNEELDFFDSIDQIKSKIDFVYNSGALQYVSEPYTFIKSLCKLNAGYLFFNRMIFTEENKEIIRIQKTLLSLNGPGKLPKGYTDKGHTYPHTTISWEKFNNILLDNNYEIKWLFDEKSGDVVKTERLIDRGILYTYTAVHENK